MVRQVLGIALVILGAIVMIINISFLKTNAYYDGIRGLSFAVFMIGIFLIPRYSKSKKQIT
ncbi:hypothetical protein [Alkalihalobacillus sp. R86527]|uniref:hypothetical protein n=1 Tax=Alkalihalobacillus sp. R86527 TaxID=3093863 RepID=UPI003671AADC